jgi:membrane associated rhomboid family serine protease
MDDIFTKLKRLFTQGSFLIKLIFVNIGIFLLFRLTIVFLTLFQIGEVHFLQYFEMPSSFSLLLSRPWTIITYMFMHIDLLHLVFNMLWLYWFGKIFLMFFNERQLGGLYFSGGIAGALLFLIAYSLFPYFQNVVGTSYLLGASASVMAIVFAISFYQKNYEINLLFFGRIKLIYLALISLLIDLLSITSTNAGGHIAHLGGALFGVLFALQFQKGRDLTFFVNKVIDFVVNLKKPRAKMKVTYKRPETDMEYNARKKDEISNVDAILDKLKRSGYESLSSEEKKALFDASKK